MTKTPDEIVKPKVESIGTRLRAWRKNAGKTLSALSNLIAVSQGSLSDLENGHSFPSAQTLVKLCLLTDLNVVWLLTGAESMTDPVSRCLGKGPVDAAADEKLRPLIRRLIRLYQNSTPARQAYLEGFLLGAYFDQNE